ncbi:MAG: murein L,D-transpeptidase catalytic domain family protein [Sphingobacteriales bacterium]|nr:murein L,D-transpeptidase catalytic domain family protein [Sphingobacteriales bacterium]
MKKNASDLCKYALNNGYNTQTCFLINMNIESGKNRFFVYQMEKDSIYNAGLVTHGSCNSSWLTGKRFSNNIGCGCTALGKYRVGKSYMGRFGLAYKLYGLDSTNNNSFNRFIVLHSHGCVPDGEVSPLHICQSLGCPIVSPGYLKYL